MDEPEFYRDDIQAFYDLQLVQGRTEIEAVAALRKKFKITKEVVVTPTGEVRVAGVTDDPDPPAKAAPPPPPPVAPASADADDEKEKPEPKEPEKKPDEAVSLSEACARLERFRARTEALDRAARYSRFMRLVNMPVPALRAHLRSSVLHEVLSRSRRGKTVGIREGKTVAPRIMRMKGAPIESWTDEDWTWCDRVVQFIERTRKNGAPLIESGVPTRKTVLLRTWGHDPLSESAIKLDELRELLEWEDRSAGLRLIDATATVGPVQVILDERAPSYAVLRANRKPLTADEGVECDPARVWKSVVEGRTWYVLNTHRAYAASTNVGRALENCALIRCTE